MHFELLNPSAPEALLIPQHSLFRKVIFDLCHGSAVCVDQLPGKIHPVALIHISNFPSVGWFGEFVWFHDETQQKYFVSKDSRLLEIARVYEKASKDRGAGKGITKEELVRLLDIP